MAEAAAPAAPPLIDSGMESSHGTPDVCRKMVMTWPGNPGEMVELMMNCLGADTQEALAGLMPVDQAGIATAFMLSVPDDPTHWDVMVGKFIARIQGSTPSNSRAESSLSSPRSTGRGSTVVQFVIAGMPLAVGALLVNTLKNILPKMHADATWNFHAAILFRTEADHQFDLSAWSASFDMQAVALEMDCDVASDLSNRLEG